jgi:hypothetical protein
LNWTDLVVEALGETVYADLNKCCRLHQDWAIVLDEGAIYLKVNDISMDREWLKSIQPDIFAQTKFKGGLESFGNDR